MAVPTTALAVVAAAALTVDGVGLPVWVAGLRADGVLLLVLPSLWTPIEFWGRSRNGMRGRAGLSP